MGYYALLVPNTGLAKAAGVVVDPGVHLSVELRLAVHALGARSSWPCPWWRPGAAVVGEGDRLAVLVLAHPWRRGWWTPSTWSTWAATTCTPGCSSRRGSASAYPSSSAADGPGTAPGPRCRDRRMGGRLRRLAAVRATAGHQPQSADRAHLQRAQQLDLGHRQRPSDHGGRLRKGPLGVHRRAVGPPGPARAPGHQRLLVVTDPYTPLSRDATLPGRSSLPFTLGVDVPAIGVIGYLAGPDVYLFDSYSLANPIGSHTVVVHHARPGHEKLSDRPGWSAASAWPGT